MDVAIGLWQADILPAGRGWAAAGVDVNTDTTKAFAEVGWHPKENVDLFGEAYIDATNDAIWKKDNVVAGVAAGVRITF